MNSDAHSIDPTLLERARQVLGTSETKDTLELALSLAIQQASRKQAVAAELARFAAGRYRTLPSDRGGGLLSGQRGPSQVQGHRP